MILVIASDLHEARARHGGYCVSGVDLWFKRHNLELRHFLKHGYPVEVIEATNDEFGLRVARIARERNAK